MSEVYVEHLAEQHVEGKRLGRHIEHDPASKEYSYESHVGLTPASALVAVTHTRHGGIFNQGQIGSCTGNATAGARNTEPVYKTSDDVVKEAAAQDIYRLATELDNIPGQWPPDDTGSSGLSAAKAAMQLGMITKYLHAFSMDEVLSALQTSPVITGVSWYEGFDTPDANGLVKIGGSIRGGHEIVARGYEPNDSNPDDALILLDNSWGTSYGQEGHFYWTVGTWKQLLAQQGDVTILVP